ncbi:MAG TPA: peptide chain release factor N(5)-glutamine methyltransferase [Hanamia sp.]
MTTQQAYNGFKEKLKKIYDEREADNITDWIFEKVTHLKKTERRTHHNVELAETHLNLLQKYLEELLQHKPLQYVLNEAWFFKRKFYVNENVLIPRPETEELVEWIINDVKAGAAINPITNTLYTLPQIIDIGTGSGCISVSIKKELSNANVTAIDVSEKALSVAKKNAGEINVEIGFLRIDFLNENEWESLLQYDIIVSNPPYIPIKEKEILAKNVTAFEPGIALFVPEDNPYIFYEKIAKFAKTHLYKNGKIYVEVHEEFAKDVKVFFENAGFIPTIKKDIYGKERMVKAIKAG